MNKLLKYLYFIILIFILFFRNKSLRKPNFEIYIIEWIPYIFKNKIIFINVIGNIFLFIPLGYYIGLLNGIIFSVIIELLQFYLSRGVFDIVDIILNSIGVTVGCIVLWMIKKMELKN